MIKKIAFVILILLAAGMALSMRLPRLELRPMHADEAVHAYKLGEHLAGERYRYDPQEYHGPTQHYLTLPVTWIRGIERYADLDEASLRIVPVIFGTLLVALLLGIGDGLGYWAAALAGVLTAVSVPMTFYSRYYIMEVLLVFFTFLLIVGGWRYVKGRSVWGAVAAGVGLGLMHATKETWVFAAAAMAAAILVNVAWGRWVAGDRAKLLKHAADWRIAAGAGAAAFVAVLFLSSFFTNASGPWDSIMTYVYGLRRAGGAGSEAGDLHVHPWRFYIERLLYFRYGTRGPIWSEALIVGLAVVGTLAGFAGRGLGGADAKLVRFLGVYGFTLLAIYSVIPYKTPWCILGAHHGLILVAGVGAVTLLRLPMDLWRWGLAGVSQGPRTVVRWAVAAPLQVALAVGLAWGVGQLRQQSQAANFKYYDSNYNPWVYSQTLRDTVRLGERADELAALADEGYDTPVHVCAPDPHDYWPLPWYLRRFNRVGYLSELQSDSRVGIVVFVPELWGLLPREKQEKFEQQYIFEHRGLRPGKVLCVGIRMDIWEKFIEKIMAEEKAKKEQAMAHPEQSVSDEASDEGELQRFSHRSMGCIFEVLIPEGQGESAGDAAEAAFEELDRIEKLLTRFDPYSDVSRINTAEVGVEVIVDIETAECLAAARRLWQETDRAFDVTAGVVVDANHPEPARRIDAGLLEVDEESFSVRRMDERLQVDLGGVGKGFALDRMAEVLREWDIPTALLHGGSSTVLAMGSGPHGRGWRMALRDPADETAEPLGWIRLTDRAFSGSATVHARHITDPRTGRAVQANRAAWAVADTATRADALTTAFCVMEISEIERYAERHQDVAFVVAFREDDAWRMHKFGPPMVTDEAG